MENVLKCRKCGEEISINKGMRYVNDLARHNINCGGELLLVEPKLIKDPFSGDKIVRAPGENKVEVEPLKKDVEKLLKGILGEIKNEDNLLKGSRMITNVLIDSGFTVSIGLDDEEAFRLGSTIAKIVARENGIDFGKVASVDFKDDISNIASEKMSALRERVDSLREKNEDVVADIISNPIEYFVPNNNDSDMGPSNECSECSECSNKGNHSIIDDYTDIGFNVISDMVSKAGRDSDNRLSDSLDDSLKRLSLSNYSTSHNQKVSFAGLATMIGILSEHKHMFSEFYGGSKDADESLETVSLEALAGIEIDTEGFEDLFKRTTGLDFNIGEKVNRSTLVTLIALSRMEGVRNVFKTFPETVEITEHLSKSILEGGRKQSEMVISSIDYLNSSIDELQDIAADTRYFNNCLENSETPLRETYTVDLFSKATLELLDKLAKVENDIIKLREAVAAQVMVFDSTATTTLKESDIMGPGESSKEEAKDKSEDTKAKKKPAATEEQIKKAIIQATIEAMLADLDDEEC